MGSDCKHEDYRFQKGWVRCNDCGHWMYEFHDLVDHCLLRDKAESYLAKSQERVEELGIQHGNLVEKFSRLLYITGQLTMLRDKEGDEYKKLYAEYIVMKYPELKEQAERQSGE
jgi:hypothetical protein